MRGSEGEGEGEGEDEKERRTKGAGKGQGVQGEWGVAAERHGAKNGVE